MTTNPNNIEVIDPETVEADEVQRRTKRTS